MRAVLVIEDAELASRVWLGMPVGLRAACALAEAGATRIEVAGVTELPAFLRDARLQVPVSLYAGGPGDALVLRAQAVVSASVLRALPDGERVADGTGAWLAGQTALSAGADLDAAVARLRPVALSEDRYHFAVRLHDAPSFARGEKLLFDALIKPTDGPVSRHLNRHLSRAVTRLVLPLGVTPNQMTVAVALCGLAAAWLATSPAWRLQAAGALLYQLHSVLDGCDGELARLTRRFGKHGALIDSLVDDLCNALFFVGLGVGVGRSLGERWPLYAAALSGVAYAGVVVVQYRVVLRQTGRGDKTSFWQGQARGLTAFSIAKTLLRRDVFVLLICLAVCAGLAKVAVALFPLAALGTLAASLSRKR